MRRKSEEFLTEWHKRLDRKPLIIRGARQVGKSTLVRNFSAYSGIPLFELNLEKHRRLDSVFATLDVRKIFQEIELALGVEGVSSGQGILFLDEIQAAPQAIAALRYLHEEAPQVPVIAAGSLMEFSLSDRRFTMPVGRVEFHFLGPMDIEEFLEAAGERALVDHLRAWRADEDFSSMAHERLLDRLREFLLTGGMPEAVKAHLEGGSMARARQAQEGILESYREDFGKYATPGERQKLPRVFEYCAAAVGRKFKYSNVDPDWRAKDVRGALDLLAMAGVVSRVHHSDGGAIPLGAQADDGVFKPLFLDVGLMNALCGSAPFSLEQFRRQSFVNEGSLAEQYVGQHLLYARTGNLKPSLHYWLREGKSGNAEVDYLVPAGDQIIPVEVKASATGALKSLHLFMALKGGRVAVRFNLNPPSRQRLHATVPGGGEREFDLFSLPLYMVGQLGNLMNATFPP